MKEFYKKGFIKENIKVRLILKFQKIGYEIYFYEYGQGTFIQCQSIK